MDTNSHGMAFGPSPLIGHGTWLVCEVALIRVYKAKYCCVESIKENRK